MVDAKVVYPLSLYTDAELKAELVRRGHRVLLKGAKPHFGLTGRQAEVYNFVLQCVQKDGKSPSIREIAEHIGIRGAGGAHYVVDHLVERGALLRLPGRRRSLAPVI